MQNQQAHDVNIEETPSQMPFVQILVEVKKKR